MNSSRSIFFITLLLGVFFSATAQQNLLIPDLSKVRDQKIWTTVNREISFDSAVFLNKRPGDGLLYLKGSKFKNGKIELDIRGENNPGQSFVGVAFHGVNDSTFEAVYFRPFNFKNPQRNNHSVQFISMPQYNWYKLRTEHPGKYENKISPVPDPSGWFHATIVVKYPVIKVFVNNSGTPSLVVHQISSRQIGWVGFWVGNNSRGWFKNLKITSDTE